MTEWWSPSCKFSGVGGAWKLTDNVWPAPGGQHGACPPERRTERAARHGRGASSLGLAPKRHSSRVMFGGFAHVIVGRGPIPR